MDSIDRLIKKMGHDVLIDEILKRKEYGNFRYLKKSGAPRYTLDKLWGLQKAFNDMQSLHPKESKQSIADRLLEFTRNYERMLLKPDIYNSELIAGKAMYQNVSWLKRITAKTIVNKVTDLNSQMQKISSRHRPKGLSNSMVFDDVDVETLVDNPS